MADHILVTKLTGFDPSLLVRNESGETKTIVVGNSLRGYLSSQCVQREIRAMFEENIVKSCNLSDLIQSFLTKKAESGAFKEEYIVPATKVLCELFNAAYHNGSKKKEENGNTIATVPVDELYQILSAVSEILSTEPDLPIKEAENEKKKGKEKEKEKEFDKPAKDKIREIAQKLHRTIVMPDSLVLWGLMATEKEALYKTVYGAVNMNYAYSINRFNGESDFWIANHVSTPVSREDTDTDFFEVFNDFSAKEHSKPNADNMGNCDVSANVMFQNMAVDLKTLYSNINYKDREHSLLHGEKGSSADEFAPTVDAKEKSKQLLEKLIKGFITTSPAGKQRTMLSKPTPDMVYIEISKDTQLRTPSCFQKPVVEEDVMGEGIRRILEWSQDDTFSVGETTKYVLLSKAYSKYAPEFEAAGIKVLNNIREELDNMIDSEIDKIEKDYNAMNL